MPRHERRTWFVVALTAVMMVGEIAVGWLFRIDGAVGRWLAHGDPCCGAWDRRRWPICSRAGRRAIRSFTFGTGKFGDLAAFSSAIILAMIAVQVAYESVVRLISSGADRLRRGDCGRGARPCRQSRQRVAVARRSRPSPWPRSFPRPWRITTTTTTFVRPMSTSWPMPRPRFWPSRRWWSRWFRNWVWADPAVGIVGSLVIASWAVGLIRASGAVLLDVNADKNLETVIRDRS